MRKYLVGLLAAYAATTTLLAVHWSAEAWVYRHCFNLLMEGKHGRPVRFPNLIAIYADFGLDQGTWVYWYLRVADSQKFLTAVIGGAVRLRADSPKVLGSAKPTRRFSSCSMDSPTGRPYLARELLKPGDVLVVWRLDRLGRSLRHLIELMAELENQGIDFQSVQEAIDTTTPGGKLVFHVFGALAEFERNLIRERTHAGLTSARARGRSKPTLYAYVREADINAS